MSTTQQTSSANSSNLQFNPIAQGIYNQLIGQGGSALNGYMNNPFGNAFYQQGLGMSQAGAAQAGANNTAALKQNALTSGLTGPGGSSWMGAETGKTQRANQSMMSQSNIQNVMQALSRQMTSAGTGLAFSPQLTGQSGTSTGKQSSGGFSSFIIPQIMSAFGSGGMNAWAQTGGQQQQAFSGGSIGGTSAPQLGSPSYMPSLAMAGTAGGDVPAPSYMNLPPGAFAPPPNFYGGG